MAPKTIFLTASLCLDLKLIRSKNQDENQSTQYIFSCDSCLLHFTFKIMTLRSERVIKVKLKAQT